MKESGLGTDPLQRTGDSGARAADGGEIVVSTAAAGAVSRRGAGGVISGAIGVIQVRGFVPMVAAMDAMTKAANVALMGYETAGDGLTAALIHGEVGAVRYAVDAGADAARRVGEVLAATVLARPDSAMAETLPMTEEDLRQSRTVPTVGGKSL